MGLLMRFFKKKEFKDWQLRVIKAVLGGKNALIVQPTGSGKSLCFQFPCTITGKMTIALLPTVSLILDQVKALETTGLKVTYLGTMQSDRTVMGKIAQAQYDIVLSTPESTMTAYRPSLLLQNYGSNSSPSTPTLLTAQSYRFSSRTSKFRGAAKTVGVSQWHLPFLFCWGRTQPP